MKYRFIKFTGVKQQRKNIPWHGENNVEMAQLKDKGWSYQEIGRKYNLTKQRVHQILTTIKP